MHLLNCLLLKLYKHCRRSHCRCTPSPSALLYNERQWKRAHKKFRGHCIDGMLDGAPVSSLGPTWTAWFFVKRSIWTQNEKGRVQVKHCQHKRRKHHYLFSKKKTWCDVWHQNLSLQRNLSQNVRIFQVYYENYKKLFDKFFGSIIFLVLKFLLGLSIMRLSLPKMPQQVIFTQYTDLKN